MQLRQCSKEYRHRHPDQPQWHHMTILACTLHEYSWYQDAISIPKVTWWMFKDEENCTPKLDYLSFSILVVSWMNCQCGHFLILVCLEEVILANKQTYQSSPHDLHFLASPPAVIEVKATSILCHVYPGHLRSAVFPRTTPHFCEAGNVGTCHWSKSSFTWQTQPASLLF